MWHKKSPPLPLAPRHPLCKCAKETLLTKEDFSIINCETCNNTRLLRDASPQMSPIKSPLSAKLPPKQLLSPNKFDLRKSPDGRTLEKSNSLNESNPSKQLRSAKSLSPRAPIKHQSAIDDAPTIVVIDDEPRIYRETVKELIVDSLRINIDYEKQKNRSTSCLIYVPSDPWTKMDDQTVSKKGAKRMKKLMDVKSQSKPDLIDAEVEHVDPWVKHNDANGNCKTSRSSTTCRQSKSLHIDSKSGTARPRMQRSKSPVTSPKDPLSSLSPTLGYHLVPSGGNNGAKQKKKGTQQQQFLNVSNPNLLQQQSRHSFSTSPTSSSSGYGGNGAGSNKRDDELTLNIRRLSEQIKCSSTYASYGNFHANNTANNPNVSKHTSSDNTAVTMEKSASLLSDSLLETTC